MQGSILCFNSRDLLLRIDLTNVAYVEAMGNYSKIVMLNGLKTAVRRTLTEILNDIKQRVNHFVRAGKSLIINTTHVFLVDSVHGTLILSDGKYFCHKKAVSRSVLKEIRQSVLR